MSIHDILYTNIFELAKAYSILLLKNIFISPTESLGFLHTYEYLKGNEEYTS